MDSLENLKPQIRINGVEISEQAIASEMQYHPAESQQAAYDKAAMALAVRELLLQESARLNLQPRDNSEKQTTAEEELIEKLIGQAVETPKADESNCKTFFENNRNRFKTPPLIEASHILLPAKKEDIKARQDAKKAADLIIEELNSGTSFEQLAKQHSVCPSAKTGGSLGQLSSGQTAPEFERQVFLLPEGLALHPVETRYGYHIVRIDRRVDGRLLDYPQVKDKIRSYLDTCVQHKAINQYIQQLANNAKLEGIELDQYDSPLMQ